MAIADPITYLPNKVIEKQKYYQSKAHLPVFMRHRTSRIHMPLFTVWFAGSMAFTGYTVYQLVFGKPQSQE